MKTVMSMMAAMALTFAVTAARAADDAKEVTLKGEGQCAKCKLGETEKCQDALVVKEGDKTVTYYLKAKGLHPKVCQGTKGLTVTGKVTEKDGKKWVEVSKFELDK